jgi:DNA-binding IclR family transcriptional regulator
MPANRNADDPVTTARGGVKSADRVVQVLDFLANRSRPQRFIDIVDHLGLPKSSANALINTLVDSGLIARDMSGRHRLGLRLLAYADAALRQFDLGVLARPAMEDLCERLQGVCNLGALHGHHVTYLQAVQGTESPIQITTRLGGRLPAHATAMGKVLVGELSPAQRDQWLAEHEFRKLTTRTIVSARQLKRAIDAYHRAGYATDDEESLPGVMCVAAGITDHRGATIAALSFTDLKPRLLDRGIDKIAAEIMATAREISTELGLTRPDQRNDKEKS